MADRGDAERRGMLSMTFAFPQAAFLYRQSGPRLRVDGVEIPVRGWGTHRIPVDAGSHEVRVWVPYMLPRRVGKARIEVSVSPGETARLEYLAPTLAFRGGSLGEPGRQTSAGYSTVRVINVVAIVAVLVLIVLALALR